MRERVATRLIIIVSFHRWSRQGSRPDPGAPYGRFAPSWHGRPSGPQSHAEGSAKAMDSRSPVGPFCGGRRRLTRGRVPLVSSAARRGEDDERGPDEGERDETVDAEMLAEHADRQQELD